MTNQGKIEGHHTRLPTILSTGELTFFLLTSSRRPDTVQTSIHRPDVTSTSLPLYNLFIYLFIYFFPSSLLPFFPYSPLTTLTTGKNGARVSQNKIVWFDFRNNMRMAWLNRKAEKYGHFAVWLCHISNAHAKSLGLNQPYPDLPFFNDSSPVEKWGLEGICLDERINLLEDEEDDEDDIESATTPILSQEEVIQMCAVLNNKRVTAFAPNYAEVDEINVATEKLGPIEPSGNSQSILDVTAVANQQAVHPLEPFVPSSSPPVIEPVIVIDKPQKNSKQTGKKFSTTEEIAMFADPRNAVGTAFATTSSQYKDQWDKLTRHHESLQQHAKHPTKVGRCKCKLTLS